MGEGNMENIWKRTISLLLVVLMLLDILGPVTVQAQQNSIIKEDRNSEESLTLVEGKSPENYKAESLRLNKDEDTDKEKKSIERSADSKSIIHDNDPIPRKDSIPHQDSISRQDPISPKDEENKDKVFNAPKKGYVAWKLINLGKTSYKKGEIPSYKGLLVEVTDSKGNVSYLNYKELLADKNINVKEITNSKISQDSEEGKLIISAPGLKDIVIGTHFQDTKITSQNEDETLNQNSKDKNLNILEEEKDPSLLDKLLGINKEEKIDEIDLTNKEYRFNPYGFNSFKENQLQEELTEEELEAGLTIYQMPTIPGNKIEDMSQMSRTAMFRSPFMSTPLGLPGLRGPAGGGNNGLNLDGKKFTIRTRFDTSNAIGPVKAGQFFKLHLDNKLKVNNPNELKPITYRGEVIATPEYNSTDNTIKYTITKDINENIQVLLNIPVDYNTDNITLDSDGTFTVTNKVSGLGVKAPKDLVPQKVDKNGNPAGSIIEPGRDDVTEIIEPGDNYRVNTTGTAVPFIENRELKGYNWTLTITSDTDLNALGYKANFTTVKGSGLGEIENRSTSITLEDNPIKGSFGIVDSKHHEASPSTFEITYNFYTPVTNRQSAYMLDVSVILSAKNKVGARRVVARKGYPEEKIAQVTPSRVGMNNRTTIMGEFTSENSAKWTVTDGVCTGDNGNLPLATRTIGGQQTLTSAKMAVYGLDDEGKMVVKQGENDPLSNLNNTTPPTIPSEGTNPTGQKAGAIAVYEYDTNKDPQVPDDKIPLTLGGVAISKYEDIYIDQSWTLGENLKMPSQTVKAVDSTTNSELGTASVPASTNSDYNRSILIPGVKVWNIDDSGGSERKQPIITQEFPTTDEDSTGRPINYYESNNYYLKEDNQYYIRNRATVESAPKLGNFTLIKTGENGAPLPGATFKLLNGPEVVTDDQGRAVFSNVEPGTHQLVETKAPTGYKINTSSTIFNVDSEGRISIIGGPGTLKVGTIPTVTVADPTWPDYMNAMQYATVDGEGNVVTYIFLKANAAQYGGSTDKNTRLSLYMNNGSISNVEVFDVEPSTQRDRLKADMTAQTADQMIGELGESVLNRDNEHPIKGKENVTDPYTGNTGYQILMPKERFTRDWGFLVKVTGRKTENTGDPSLTYDWLSDGNYDFTNNNAKLRNQNIVPTSTSGADNETTITITNEAFETRPVEVTKIKKDKTPIEGATFEIKNEQGDVISTVISGADGKVSFGKLPEGKYTIEEIKAPKGYMKSNVIFDVTVDSSNKVTYVPKFKTGSGNPVNGEDYLIENEEQTQEENKNVVTSVEQTLSIQENEDGDIGQRLGVWEAYRLESLKYKATIQLGDTAPGKRFSIQFDPNLDFTQYFGEFPKLEIKGKEVADPYFDYTTNLLTYVFNDESAGGTGTANINFRGIIPSKYFAKNDDTYNFTITVAPGQTDENGQPNVGGHQTITQPIVADYGYYDYDPKQVKSSQAYYFRDVYQKEDGSWYVTVLAYYNPHYVKVGSNDTLNFNWKSTNYQDGNYVNWRGNGQTPAFSLQDVKVYRTSPNLRKINVQGFDKTINDNMPLSFGVRPEQDPSTYYLMYSKSINPNASITNDRQNGITLNYNPSKINPFGTMKDKGPLSVQVPSVNNRNQDGYIIEQTFKIDDMYKFNNAWRAFNMSNDAFNSAFVTRANYNKATGDQTGGEIPKFYSQKVRLINKTYTPAKFSIEKTNELDSNTKLQGAQFSLTDPNGDIIYRTTGSDGKIEFTDLEPGSYTLKEEKAPTGYTKSDKIWRVEVNSDGNVNINEIGVGASNNPIYGNNITLPVTNKPTAVKFVVYKKDGNNKPLQGAGFKLSKRGEDNNFTDFAIGTSDDKGVVSFDKDLTTGTYLLEETNTPPGYKKLNKKWVVEVDGNNKAKVYDYVEGNQNPTDPTVNQSLLGVAGTKWVNVAKRPLTGWVLGDNRQTGYVDNYPVPHKMGTRIVAINKTGNYVIQRYVINPEANDVTLDKAIIHREKPEYDNMTWYNGDEEIKIFSLDKAVTGNVEDIRLENFRLTELLPQDVTKSTVDVNGQNRLQLNFNNRQITKPIVVDVKVPYTAESGGVGTGMDLYTNEGTFWKSDYYNFVTDIVEGDPVVTTGDAGNIKGAYISDDSLEVANIEEKHDFSFKKIRENTTDAVSGATFKLVGPQPSDTEIYKKSGTDGVVSFTDLKPGVYRLVETGAAQGYDLANTDWTVTITRDGKTYVRDNNQGTQVPDNDPAKQWQKVTAGTQGTIQGRSDVQNTLYGNRLETRITEVNKKLNKFRQVYLINKFPEKLEDPYFEIHAQQENRPQNLTNTRILSVEQVQNTSTLDNLIPIAEESSIGYQTEVYEKNNQERIKITPTNLVGEGKTVAITIEADMSSSENVGTGIDFYNFGTNHYWLSEYYQDSNSIQLDPVSASTTDKNANMIVGENGTGKQSRASMSFYEAGLPKGEQDLLKTKSISEIVVGMVESGISKEKTHQPLRGGNNLGAISPYNIDSTNANITVSADAVDTTNGSRNVTVSISPKTQNSGTNKSHWILLIDRSKDFSGNNLDNNINKFITDLRAKADTPGAEVYISMIEYSDTNNLNKVLLSKKNIKELDDATEYSYNMGTLSEVGNGQYNLNEQNVTVRNYLNAAGIDNRTTNTNDGAFNLKPVVDANLTNLTSDAYDNKYVINFANFNANRAKRNYTTSPKFYQFESMWAFYEKGYTRVYTHVDQDNTSLAPNSTGDAFRTYINGNSDINSFDLTNSYVLRNKPRFPKARNYGPYVQKDVLDGILNNSANFESQGNEESLLENGVLDILLDNNVKLQSYTISKNGSQIENQTNPTTNSINKNISLGVGETLELNYKITLDQNASDNTDYIIHSTMTYKPDATSDTVNLDPNSMITRRNAETPVTYIVSFDGNGGTGTMSPVTKNKGESYTLPANGFTPPTDKEFKAWEVNEQEKNPGESIIINADTTVKALWKDKAPDTYTITVNASQNGTVTSDAQSAAANTTVTLTVSPDANYEIDTLTVKDANEQAVDVDMTNYTFTMPASNVIVTATFKHKQAGPYTVTVTQPTEGGTISADQTSAAEGATVNLTATPSQGFVLDGFTVTAENGSTVTVTNNQFTMPASNVTVSASFRAANPEDPLDNFTPEEGVDILIKDLTNNINKLLEITNKPSGLDLRILKKNIDNEPLAGAKFTIKKMTDNTYATEDTNFTPVSGESDKDGNIVFKDNDGKIVKLQKGFYVLKEDQAPIGYKKITADWKIEVKDENGQIYAEYKGPEETPSTFVDDNDKSNAGKSADNDTIKYKSRLTFIDPESKKFVQRIYIDTRGATSDISNVQITPKYKREEIDTPGQPPVTIKEGVKTAYRLTYKIEDPETNEDIKKKDFDKILRTYDLSRKDMTMVNTARWRPFDWGFDEDQLNLGKGVYIIEVEGYYDDSIIDGTVTNEVKIDNNYNILDAAGNIITDLNTQTPGKVDSYDRTKLPTTDPRYINPDDLGKIDLHVDFYAGERKFKQLKFDENGNQVYEAFDGASYQGGAASVRKKYEDALIAQGKTKKEAKELADAWANSKPAGQKYANFVGRKVNLDGTDYDTGKIDPALPANPTGETDTSINLKPLYSTDNPSVIPKDGLEVENDKEAYNITFSKHGRDNPADDINSANVTNKRLEGAIFKLEKLVAGGYEDVPGTYVSSAFNGYFGFRGLKPGRYRLMEVKAPKGYVPIKGAILYMTIAYQKGSISEETGEITPGKGVITLEYNNTNSIVQYAGANAEGEGKLVDFVTSATAKNMGKIVNNKPGKGKVEINKKDGLGGILPGAEFKLIRTSLKDSTSPDSFKTGTVGSDGKLVFDNLIIGNYELIETKPADGHQNTGETWKFTVGGKGLDPYADPIEPTGTDLTSKISTKSSTMEIVKPKPNDGTTGENTIWPNSAHVMTFDNEYKITAGTEIKPGDYFKVKLSDYMNLKGIYKKELITGLDIFADGIGTIAKADYDDVNGIITYTFTDYAKTYELTSLKTSITGHIDPYKLKTSYNNVPVGLIMNGSTEEFKKVNLRYDLGTQSAADYQSSLNMSSKITYFDPQTGEFVHYIYINREQALAYSTGMTYKPGKDVENLVIDVYEINNKAVDLDEVMPPSYGVEYNPNNMTWVLNKPYSGIVNDANPGKVSFPSGIGKDDSYIVKVTGKIADKSGETPQDKSYYNPKARLDAYYSPVWVERENFVYGQLNENTATGKLEITAINPKNEISFKKVDQNGNPLKGAKFGLLNYSETTGKWAENIMSGSERNSGEDGLIKYEKLAPGKYALIETEAPAGYSKIEGHIEEFTVGTNGVITRGVSNGTTSTQNQSQGTSSVGRLIDKVKSFIGAKAGGDQSTQPATDTDPVANGVIGTSPIEIINYKEIEFKKIDGNTRSGLSGAILEVWYKEKETDQDYKQYKNGSDTVMTVSSGKGGAFKLNLSKDGCYALKEIKAPEGYTKMPGWIREFKLEKGKLQVLEKDPFKASLVKGANDKITSQILEIDKDKKTFKQRLIINPNHDSWSFDGPDTQLRIFTNENWSIDPTDTNSISKIKVAVVDKGKSIADLKDTDFKEKESFNYTNVDSIRRFRIKNLINDNSGATTLTTDKAIVVDITGKLAEGKTSAELKSEIYFDYKIIDEVTYNLDINNISEGKGAYVDPVMPIEIENRKAEYPRTGGMGTLIFTVSGLMLMSVAGYVYKRKRRDSYDE